VLKSVSSLIATTVRLEAVEAEPKLLGGGAASVVALVIDIEKLLRWFESKRRVTDSRGNVRARMLGFDKATNVLSWNNACWWFCNSGLLRLLRLGFGAPRVRWIRATECPILLESRVPLLQFILIGFCQQVADWWHYLTQSFTQQLHDTIAISKDPNITVVIVGRLLIVDNAQMPLLSLLGNEWQGTGGLHAH